MTSRCKPLKLGRSLSTGDRGCTGQSRRASSSLDKHCAFGLLARKIRPVGNFYAIFTDSRAECKNSPSSPQPAGTAWLPLGGAVSSLPRPYWVKRVPVSEHFLVIGSPKEKNSPAPRARASKGPPPLGAGTVKQSEDQVQGPESPSGQTLLQTHWYICRCTLRRAPSPRGLFTYHRSSGPVFWCIHGLRHTKYHMLGAETGKRISQVQAGENRVEGNGFDEGCGGPLQSTSRKALFWKNKQSYLHLWFPDSSQLSSGFCLLLPSGTELCFGEVRLMDPTHKRLHQGRR